MKANSVEFSLADDIIVMREDWLVRRNEHWPSKMKNVKLKVTGNDPDLA